MVTLPKKHVFLALLALAALGISTQAQERDLKTHFAAALERAAESVVLVQTRPAICESTPVAGQEDAVFNNTGFFVGTEGEVLTSLLCVAGCGDIRVVPIGGKPVEARVLAVDQPAGLALLKTDLTGTLPFQSVAEEPGPGDWLMLATARPDVGLLVQPGLTLPKRGGIRINGVAWAELPLTIMYVRPGAAHAPLVDPQGRLRAVLLGVKTRGSDLPDASLCYMLPATRLAERVAPMLRGESRRLGWLGVAVVKEGAGREGVKVAAILEGSAAAENGIRPGDELLQLNGTVIESDEMFAEMVSESTPGSSVDVALRRGNELTKVTVTIGTRPMIICGASRREGEPVVTPTQPVTPQTVGDLIEENRRLRQELAAMKRALQKRAAR